MRHKVKPSKMLCKVLCRVLNRWGPSPYAYGLWRPTFYCRLQSFWQRVQNYLQSVLLELLILPTVLGPINNFVKQAGLDYPLYQTGWSYYSATILVGDWALEFPHALPPTHHVSGVGLAGSCTCIVQLLLVLWLLPLMLTSAICKCRIEVHVWAVSAKLH